MNKLAGVVAAITLLSACHKNKTAATAAQAPVIIPPAAPPQVKPRRQVSRVPETHQPPAPSTPSREAPRLGQMLSPEEQRQYNNSIDRSLMAAQSSLQQVSTHKLSVQQQNSVREIQDFIRQATDIRKNDLVGAKGLADKAQVLARDLAQNVQ